MCPDNYVAVDGGVSGGWLKAGFSASMEECKNDCDSRTDCNSLSYSPSNTQCKLMKEKEPTSSSKYQDYQFCKRKILRKF